MRIKNSRWSKTAKLDGKIIGTLVLPREPKEGSNIILPKINKSERPIHVSVLKIDEEFIDLKRRN